MKTFQISLLSFFLIFVSQIGFAQTKTEKIKVAGECGMCKKKIETAAKKAGASYAAWDSETKELTVKYKSTSSNTAKIEKAVAAVGYDTPNYKTTEEAYNNLDECCKYERSSSNDAKACCSDHKCADGKCMKDGKCEQDKTCCKEAGCDKKDCCKKANP